MKPFHFLGICLIVARSSIPVFGAETTNTPILPPGSNSTVVPVPHTGTGPEKDFQNKMNRFGGKHFDIIFDGDSIMNRWETTGKDVWNRRYAGIAADFGIEGDHVENVLWRVEHGQADGIDPKVIVLMIGTNNSGRNSADEIAEGIKYLVVEYEKRCPHAHIILMGIFPRGEKPTDGGRRKVAAVNSLIKNLDDGQRVTFIDISAQLTGPGDIISSDMMPDFVHPTAKGYQIWADAIQPVINKYIPSK
jgi:lysophospholipase L1-like esterase